MELKKTAFVTSFILVLAGGALADIAELPLPDSTPEEIDGYSSRWLYRAYLNSIYKDNEEASRRSLRSISTRFRDFFGREGPPKHGASFRFYPVKQTREGERALGEIYYACDRDENCDWVMRVVTVPIVLTVDWAYENFDIMTAVSSLKERNIEPGELGSQSGFLLNLPSPSGHIKANAKKQLYFGKECPAFSDFLGGNRYGQARARHLLMVSEIDKNASTPKHVKASAFDISIVKNEDALKIYHTRPIIELKISGDAGDELANKLFENIKGCPNRADAKL